MSEPNERTPEHAIPRHTTPTWEMELLLSGATVFALLQLMGFLDDRYYRAFPNFAANAETLWLLLYLYLRSAVLILAVAFVLHLMLRAHWVALVGMRSVFPQGVRMDGLRGGPVARAMAAERNRDLDQTIERADNRATIVFGVGVGLATSVLAPTLLVIAAAIPAWLIQFLPGQADRLPWWFIAFTVLLIAPLMLATGMDSMLGKWLAPEGFPARTVRRVLDAYGRIGMSQNANTVFALFSSNFGSRRSTGVVLVLMFAAFGATFWSLYREIDPGAPGAPGYWPQRLAGAPRAIYQDHYADQRRERTMSGSVPFIPAMEAGGEWLPLSIPLRPRLHNRAIERGCPEAARKPAPAGDPAAVEAQLTALLDCIATLHAVTLDGQPLADVRWDFFDRPAEGLRGVLAMIPIANLPPGRHELVMNRVESRRNPDTSQPVRLYRIPFWRVTTAEQRRAAAPE